jgi:hypothetical protein
MDEWRRSRCRRRGMKETLCIGFRRFKSRRLFPLALIAHVRCWMALLGGFLSSNTFRQRFWRVIAGQECPLDGIYAPRRAETYEHAKHVGVLRAKHRVQHHGGAARRTAELKSRSGVQEGSLQSDSQSLSSPPTKSASLPSGTLGTLEARCK